MSNKIKTSVIGSYPIDIKTFDLVKDYFDGKETFWNNYIEEAVNDMLKANIDIISDGQTRDSFINIFTRRLKGCRVRKITEIIDKVEYDKPITIDDQIFVKSLISNNIKLLGVLTGPFTLSQSVIDLFYNDKKKLAYDFAYALNEEAKKLQDVVDIISIDEPYFSNFFPEFGKELIEIVTNDIQCKIRLHVCGDISRIIPNIIDLNIDIISHEFKASSNLIDLFKDYEFSQQICYGSIRSDNEKIETVEEIIKHIKYGKSIFGDKLCQISPDCGLKLLPRNIAFQKLKNLSIAGEIINEQ